jgi:transcription elongation GreA/GreB family factor
MLKLKRITVGSRVQLQISESEVFTVQLVTPEEVDLEAGKISMESPAGKALLGRLEGEEAIIQTSQGLVRYQILRVIQRGPMETSQVK